jgi:hypothetical protein
MQCEIMLMVVILIVIMQTVITLTVIMQGTIILKAVFGEFRSTIKWYEAITPKA